MIVKKMAVLTCAELLMRHIHTHTRTHTHLVLVQQTIDDLVLAAAHEALDRVEVDLMLGWNLIRNHEMLASDRADPLVRLRSIICTRLVAQVARVELGDNAVKRTADCKRCSAFAAVGLADDDECDLGAHVARDCTRKTLDVVVRDRHVLEWSRDECVRRANLLLVARKQCTAYTFAEPHLRALAADPATLLHVEVSVLVADLEVALHVSLLDPIVIDRKFGCNLADDVLHEPALAQEVLAPWFRAREAIAERLTHALQLEDVLLLVKTPCVESFVVDREAHLRVRNELGLVQDNLLRSFTFVTHNARGLDKLADHFGGWLLRLLANLDMNPEGLAQAFLHGCDCVWIERLVLHVPVGKPLATTDKDAIVEERAAPVAAHFELVGHVDGNAPFESKDDAREDLAVIETRITKRT